MQTKANKKIIRSIFGRANSDDIVNFLTTAYITFYKSSNEKSSFRRATPLLMKHKIEIIPELDNLINFLINQWWVKMQLFHPNLLDYDDTGKATFSCLFEDTYELHNERNRCENCHKCSLNPSFEYYYGINIEVK